MALKHYQNLKLSQKLLPQQILLMKLFAVAYHGAGRSELKKS
jgi:hypothetical protein